MRARYLTALLTPTLLLLGLSLLTTQAAFAEGTPDGETPANEGVCDDLVSATPGLYGLCVAFCEAQDCDPDFSLDDPFEQCTPSSPKVLEAYNNRKSVGDPEMPCIQQTGCPCWSPEELADLPSDIGGRLGCDHVRSDQIDLDHWFISFPRSGAVFVETLRRYELGTIECAYGQTVFEPRVSRRLSITPDEYTTCTADVIASGRGRGFDCWPEP